jgi:hypothetical protein
MSLPDVQPMMPALESGEARPVGGDIPTGRWCKRCGRSPPPQPGAIRRRGAGLAFRAILLPLVARPLRVLPLRGSRNSLRTFRPFRRGLGHCRWSSSLARPLSSSSSWSRVRGLECGSRNAIQSRFSSSTVPGKLEQAMIEAIDVRRRMYAETIRRGFTRLLLAVGCSTRGTDIKQSPRRMAGPDRSYLESCSRATALNKAGSGRRQAS